MPLDRPLFVKILQRTQSENDAEALAAIRRANKMLADAGVGWSGLISGSRAPVKQGESAPPWVRPAPRMTIPEALDFLEREGELVDDLYRINQYWQRRKTLHPADQRKLFDRVYDVQRAEQRRTSGENWEPV